MRNPYYNPIMKKASIFAAAVCLFSWTVFGIVYLAGDRNITSHKILFKLFESLYMLFPMIVAGILQLIRKEPFRSTGLLNFRLNLTWLAALLLPVLTVVVCIFISAMMPGVRLHYGAEQMISQFGLDEATAAALRTKLESLSPAVYIGSQIMTGMIAGCTINALFSVGEEYGWRNYMVSALSGVGFWKKALFIGVVWGIWHMPIILTGHNYPQHPVIGVGMMCVACVLLGVIELYLVLKSGSVFPAAICHGTFNAVSGLVLILVEGGNDLTIGMTGVAGFISLSLIITGIAIYDRYVSRDGIMFVKSCEVD